MSKADTGAKTIVRERHTFTQLVQCCRSANLVKGTDIKRWQANHLGPPAVPYVGSAKRVGDCST